MKPDVITSAIAMMGLLNGTINIVAASSENELGRPLFTCAGQYGYIRDHRAGARAGIPVEQMTVLEYLAKCRFGDAVSSVASTLGDMSLKGPAAYEAVLNAVSDGGNRGMCALEPPGSLWPDALTDALPYLKTPGILKDRPYARVFQCQHVLYLLSENGMDLSDEQILETCRADKGLILITQALSDGSVQYTGWHEESGAAVSFWSMPVDLKEPWTVIDGPGGEIIDAGIRPMNLYAAGISYYDGRPCFNTNKYCVVESSMLDKPSVSLFYNKEDALSCLVERFLAANDDAAGAIVPEESHAAKDGSSAVLTVNTEKGRIWFRWDIVEINMP